MAVLWTENVLESDGDESHCPTETDDDEAEGNLLSPRLLLLFVVETTDGFEEDSWGPKCENSREKFPRVETARRDGVGCANADGLWGDEGNGGDASFWPGEGLRSANGGLGD